MSDYDDYEYSGDDSYIYDHDYDDYDFYNFDYDSDGLEVRHYLRPTGFSDHNDSESSSLSSDSQKRITQTGPVSLSLVDLCCRFLAVNFPFAYIEHRQPPVPEDLQLRIISFAFPDSKDTIMRFAKFSGNDTMMSTVRRMSREVTELCQIGFRLSGYVGSEHRKEKKKGKTRRSHFFSTRAEEIPYVSVYFDRGKITEAYCTKCDESEVSWCDHVLAVCVARIDQKNTCEIYPPLSDSLNQLSREQLLKFSQYLLCDYHKKPGIIESGQVLLNKLLKPRKSQSSDLGAGEEMTQAMLDDMNSIPGAPDLTAGAGVEDKAHWFLCEQRFLEKSVFREYSLEQMGFLGLTTTLRHLNPTLLWSNGRNLQGFVEDGFEPWIDNNDNIGRTSGGDLKLKYVYDILKEDYGTAMAAIGSWSDDVISYFKTRKETLLQGRSARARFGRRFELSVQVEEVKTLYSPRPFSWNRSCDLAKLWRVAVLNPRLTKGNRDGMAYQLKERAIKSLDEIGADEQRTQPWPGFTIAINLLQFDLHCAELHALCLGNVDALPEVCLTSDEDLVHCDMQYTVAVNTEDGTRNMKDKAEDTQTNATLSVVKTEDKPQQMAEDNLDALISSLKSINLHEKSAKMSHLQLIPRWLKCGILLWDVNTYVAVAEALQIYGQDVHATHLSCSVSFALLKFCYSCIGNKFQCSVSEKQNNKTRGDREIEAFACFPPLSLPNVALLYSILSRKPDIVENWWQNLNKARKSDSGEAIVPESISSSVSFVFQVGVMGLLVVRSPAATLDLEGDIFHHEKWLVHQLMESSPSDSDLKFLSQCLSAMLNIPDQITLSVSLAHLLFHHLFKNYSRIESLDNMTTAQKSVMESAISIFGSSIVRMKSSANQCFCLGVMWRKAANFAKEVLQITATCSSLHERVFETLVQPSGLFGDPSLLRQDCPNSDTEADYNMALYYSQSSIRGLAMVLLPSSNDVEEQGTDRPENKEEKTKILRKSQMALLMRALSSPMQSKATSFRRKVVMGTNNIYPDVWRDLLKVLQVGNFEENFKILQGLCCYSVDVFRTNEVLQICDELLKGVQSTELAQTVLTQYVQQKLVVNDDGSELLEILNWFERTRFGGYILSSGVKSQKIRLLPAVCQQLLSLSSCSFSSVNALSKAAGKLFMYTQLAAEDKWRSSSTTEVKTMQDDDSSLYQTVYSLCISFLQCVKRWWQNETHRLHRSESVRQYISDVCRTVRDIAAKDKRYYVDNFLAVASTTIERAEWMFLIVEEIAPFFPAVQKTFHRYRGWNYERETKIKDACNQSYQLRELLERCRKALEDILRGPEVNESLQQVSQKEPFYGRTGPFEKTWTERQTLDRIKLSNGLKLTECLRLTKRAHLGLYAKGEISFQSLFKELEGRHPILSVVAQNYIKV